MAITETQTYIAPDIIGRYGWQLSDEDTSDDEGSVEIPDEESEESEDLNLDEEETEEE